MILSLGVKLLIVYVIGHYLYTDLSASTNTDTMSATFSIDLELRAVQSNTKLCAEFLYWATTSGFLQVSLCMILDLNSNE